MMKVRPSESIYQFFTHSSGPEGADDNDMIVNAALATPSVFIYTVPAGNFAYISRVNILLIDTNTVTDGFAQLSALTNGILVQAMDSAGVESEDFTNGRPILQHMDFVYLAGVDVDLISGAAQPDVIKIRWTLERALNQEPLFLRPGESLRMTIRDDLTGIETFRAMVQGRLK